MISLRDITSHLDGILAHIYPGQNGGKEGNYFSVGDHSIPDASYIEILGRLCEMRWMIENTVSYRLGKFPHATFRHDWVISSVDFSKLEEFRRR